ncbi:MAG: Thioredoxin-like [Verrucomicrobiota bacterium]|jgi:peroxiredoxin
MIKLVHAILLFSLSLSCLAVAEGGNPNYPKTIAAAAITNTGGKVDVEKFTSAKTFLFVASRSDCPACQAFMKDLDKAEKNLLKAGVLVVLLSKDKDEAAMLKYIGKHNFYAIPSANKEVASISKLTGLKKYGIPYAVLADAQGVVIQHGSEAKRVLKKALEIKNK